MTMRYARFHADYTDVGRYFDRVGCNPGCSRRVQVMRAAPAARQRAAGQRIGKQARQESLAEARAERGPEHRVGRACKGPRRRPSRPKQARQESNLQPPVLETGALPIELRTSD